MILFYNVASFILCLSFKINREEPIMGLAVAMNTINIYHISLCIHESMSIHFMSYESLIILI